MKKKALIGLILVMLSPPVAIFLFLCFLMMPGSVKHEEPQQACVATVAGDTAGGWTIPIGESYRVSSPYGMRFHPIRKAELLHGGIDLATASHRAPILAASTGTVVKVSNLGSTSYGLWVEIDHGSGIKTRYAHLSETHVKVGQVVKTGERIAVEGESGGVTGPHLHFEILVGGKPVDPPTDLKARAGLSFDGKPGGQLSKPGTSTIALNGSQIQELFPAPQGVDRSDQLTAEQRAVAAAIVEEGQAAGLPARAWAIALMTALQESTLGADQSTKKPNSDGDVGVFQQRALPGWYADGKTVEENTKILNDVRYAAKTFYLGHDVAVSAAGGNPVGYHIPGLIDISGWESMPMWQAAQSVQRSAYPTAYAKHEATVAKLLTTLSITPVSYDCPAVDSTKIPENGSRGEKVVAYAMTQLGVPYSWGGGTAKGPSRGICCSPGGGDGRNTVGFDCSGLTLWAWAQVGVNLPRTSGEQQKATVPVPPDQIQAGDLLFFPGHVGIADGKGGMIEAPRTGLSVRVVPNVLQNSYWGSRFTGAGRPKG